MTICAIAMPTSPPFGSDMSDPTTFGGAAPSGDDGAGGTLETSVAAWVER
ncbi:MAG: hypothetical protein KIS78_01815 [Labilithrix sp.]|nr:hypothetical protein [Labilithrix sp.]